MGQVFTQHGLIGQAPVLSTLSFFFSHAHLAPVSHMTLWSRPQVYPSRVTTKSVCNTQKNPNVFHYASAFQYGSLDRQNSKSMQLHNVAVTWPLAQRLPFQAMHDGLFLWHTSS